MKEDDEILSCLFISKYASGFLLFAARLFVNVYLRAFDELF